MPIMPVDDVKERLKAIEMAVGQIEKQFGKGAIMRLGQKGGVQAAEAISTGSISIDYALGIGGFPRGRVVEVFGPESSGKTTLTLQVIAEAQRAGGMAAFVDAEHALDAEYAKKLGVDIDNLSCRSPTTASRRSRSSRSWCARARWTSSWSTRWRRWCRAPKSKARWAMPRWACRPA
jgi:RecA/RadA recombinase